LQVRDHGPGIPDAELSRIFERFERVASKDSAGGMGLGLYIARQIVEAHGGTITASNAPGGGASIAAQFPLSPRHP
jgi:signal transduction histidine kinase